MTSCFFVSDLHGDGQKYQKLLDAVRREMPKAVFFGGDLLPPGLGLFGSIGRAPANFIEEYLIPQFASTREKLGDAYPRSFVIMGNDDPRVFESSLRQGEAIGVWEYVNQKKTRLGRFQIYGYSFVPPTPFLMKDWERYDVSRYVDPGCVSPEEGLRSVSASDQEKRDSTIKDDLDRLLGDDDPREAVFLFHAPPHDSNLDRAALDGRTVEHVPLDVHVGSIAIRRFIEARQPYLTLHGHVHECARLTGTWRDLIGRTPAFSAAHGGPELALVRFDLENLDSATRQLI